MGNELYYNTVKVSGRVSGRRAVSRRGSAEVENILSFVWCSY